MFRKVEPWAEHILRFGMAFVFIWFGSNQLLHPTSWTALIPGWVVGSGISAMNAVYANAMFEIIAAIFLVFNVWTRWVALLLFLHLLTIVIDVGLNPIGIRDVGLSVATLCVSIMDTKRRNQPQIIR
jgi:uncharacterized membrane protein YphA (DoxX/SURF4 family)